MTGKRTLIFVVLIAATILAAAATAYQASLIVRSLGTIPAEAGTTVAAKGTVPFLSTRCAGTPQKSGQSPAVTLASQKVRLALSDGRAATFTFHSTAGTLTAHAAVGLDQECNYALLPLGETPPPNPQPVPEPTPGPAPTPAPDPQPKPGPASLRVLFTYDPAALADLPLPQQAILASPALRSYLKKHCPLESDCAGGSCPLAAHSASYRFLPAAADVTRLPAVWQGIFQAARGKPAPWLVAVNEAGQVVIDQSWPSSVEETVALLKKYGGE